MYAKGKNKQTKRSKEHKRKLEELRSYIAPKFSGHPIRRPTRATISPKPDAGITPGGPSTDGKLVRLGPRPSKGGRTSSLGNGAGAVGTTLKKYVRNGFPVPAHVHKSKASYMRGVSAGLSESSQFSGAGLHEFEEMRSGQRVLHLGGREFMDSIVTTGALSLGMRPDFGIYFLNPEALGGRLSLAAQEFEEAKCRKCRLIYVPNVPATQAGAVAIYYRQDTGARSDQVGRDQLLMAATSESFVQTPVWQECELDITPEDTMKRYFDEVSGSFKLAVQGIIEVLAASALTGGITYGNLYMEYDYEFFSPILATEIVDVPTATITLTLGIVDSTLVAGRTFKAYSNVLNNFPTVSGLSLNDINQLWYGSVVTVNTQWDNSLWSVRAESDKINDLAPFSVGAAYFARVYPLPSSSGIGNYVMTLFTSAEAAANADAPDTIPSTNNDGAADDEVVFGAATTAATYSGTLIFKMRAFTLNDDH